MTARARKILKEAMALSDDERLALAEELLTSLPTDADWLVELERRARRALADGDDAQDVIESRLSVRVARR
jgi:hypothetical protein